MYNYGRGNSSVVGGVLLLIAVLIIAMIALNISDANNQDEIRAKVTELGGQVIEIEEPILNTGPFWYKGKGDRIYRFEYTVNGRQHEGWVRFGWGADWRLDE